MEDLKQIQEFFSKPLNEGKQLDIEDFAKVVQAVTKTGHPVTVLLTPKFNEIEVLTGMNAPDDMLRDLSDAVDSLGYGRNDIIIAGDSSNLSRREYSDIRRVNGGHKDYFEESINEVKVDYDFSERELIRVLRQLKRGASTEIDMIKAFTKALGRDITKDELFSESVNEVKRPEPDYKQLVKLLIMAFKHEPKARFYFNRNNGVVYFDLIGGAAYSPKKSKMRDIFGGMNPIAVNREFGRADHYEEETIKQVEQLSNGKIKAEIKELGDGVLYKLASVNKSTIDEATKEEETEFHAKLDKLVHDTFGKRKGEMEEYNTGIYFDPAKDRMRPKAKEASKSALERVKDMIKKIASEQKMGEALSDHEEEEANYDELYSDYKYKVNEAKPKKGHGEKISKEVFAKLKGKTINYKGSDYKVVDSDEAVLTLKDEDGKSKTINLRQFNVSGMIDEIMETIELGKNLNEELCPKGKAYIKKRQAAGEKSSAYLSGRAVKVCKGQMKG